MNAKELAEKLLENPTARVAYPGAAGDLEVEVVAEVDGVIILSTEGELPGEPARPEPEPPQSFAEELREARLRGRGLLILVHEAYALLGAARPIHWLLHGTLNEASEWIRRQGVMLDLIERAGAAPPPRVPDDAEEKIRQVVGLPPKQS